MKRSLFISQQNKTKQNSRKKKHISKQTKKQKSQFGPSVLKAPDHSIIKLDLSRISGLLCELEKILIKCQSLKKQKPFRNGRCA